MAFFNQCTFISCKNNTNGLKLKVVLFASLGLLKWFWSFGSIWAHFLVKLGQLWPSMGQNTYFLCKIQTQCQKLCGKVVLFGFLGILIQFWPFGAIFGPFFCQNGPNLTSIDQDTDFLCKIQTHGLKLCGKVVLFGSQGLLIRFWPFGAIFASFWSKMARFDHLWSKGDGRKKV